MAAIAGKGCLWCAQPRDLSSRPTICRRHFSLSSNLGPQVHRQTVVLFGCALPQTSPGLTTPRWGIDIVFHSSSSRNRTELPAIDHHRHFNYGLFSVSPPCLPLFGIYLLALLNDCTTSSEFNPSTAHCNGHFPLLQRLLHSPNHPHIILKNIPAPQIRPCHHYFLITGYLHCLHMSLNSCIVRLPDNWFFTQQ